MTREEQRAKAAHEYIQSDSVAAGNEILAFGDFIEGAKWSDAHPQWIPVEERLPETIDWYLCYNDLEDGCEVLHWEGDGNVWMDNDWHYKDKEVTHWMPLPQPPRKEEEQ